MLTKFSLIFLLVGVIFCVGRGAEPAGPTLAAMLRGKAQPMTAEKANLPTLFYTIGRTYGVTVAVEPDVTGTTLLRFNGGTLRQLLSTLLEANDLFMDEQENLLTIKRSRPEFYFIEYAEITRSASSSTSVTLSPSQSTGPNGYSGIGGQSALPNANSNPQMGQAGGGSSGSTAFSISEKSGDSVWDAIEADIKAQKKAEEKLTTNRFSGIVTIETTNRRHQFWAQYIKLINERINAQVLVEVRIDELTLNSAHKLGVDWTQVETSVGGTTLGPVNTATGIASLAGGSLPGNTLLGNFSSGKLSAVLTALQQQGEIKTITKPSIRLLNNQKGFVKVGEDRTF